MEKIKEVILEDNIILEKEIKEENKKDIILEEVILEDNKE